MLETLNLDFVDWEDTLSLESTADVAIVQSFDKINKTQMWSWYPGLSYLGSQFSHLERKPSVSVSQIFGSQVSSRIFGYYFSGQNGTSPFVMGRGNPPPLARAPSFDSNLVFNLKLSEWNLSSESLCSVHSGTFHRN